MKKKVNGWIDVLYFIASVFFIGLLIVLLYNSIVYFNQTFPIVQETQGMPAQMWSLAMLIAIITVIAEWIEGRLKAIIKITSKGGKHGRKR